MTLSENSLLLTVNVHGLMPEARAENAAPETLFGKSAHGRYAYKIGLARLLDALRTTQVKATFFWPSSEALKMPHLLERCLNDGHEIASHGRAFEDHSVLSRQEEADLLGKAHDVLHQLTGQKSIGYRAGNGTMSMHTLGLLQELGYIYDSSALDDDAPYSLAADGAAKMVELPWSEGLCDATHFRRKLTQARAELFLTEELKALIPVAGYACLTLHPRGDIGIARTARLPILQRLITLATQSGLQNRLARDIATDFTA